MKSYDVTIKMKATELYFPMVLFIMLVLTFESVNDYVHANEKLLKSKFLWYKYKVIAFESIGNIPLCAGQSKQSPLLKVYISYKKYAGSFVFTHLKPLP